MVKKLNLNKIDADFSTMMDVIHQCKRFSDLSNKIDSIDYESITPIKLKPVANNRNLRSNLTVGSNLNLQTDNKSSINLLTGIVSGMIHRTQMMN